MATGTTIIDDALRALGAIAEGTSHSTDQGTYGLSVLNRLIDQMNTKRLFIYQVDEADHTWPAATASRTIGPTTGDFDTTRPQRIVTAKVRWTNGDDWPLQVTEDRRVWEGVWDKDQTGSPPTLLFYDNAWPVATLYAWPIDPAGWTLRLSTWKLLSAIATVGTTVDLPPAYEDFLVWELARRLWPTYPNAEVRDFIFAMAAEAQGALKSSNVHPVPVLGVQGVTLTNPRGTYNIYQDI